MERSQVLSSSLSLLLVVSTGCGNEWDINHDTGVDDVRLNNTSSGLYLATGLLWPLPEIPVCWENPGSFDTEREWVRDAVESSWEAYSLVNFVGWEECGGPHAGVRIKIESIEEPGPHTRGLGNALAGVPNGMSLDFTFTNWDFPGGFSGDREAKIKTIAVHEFGHALGFAHEQNRPDTPASCDERRGSSGDAAVGPWDLDSVMNYCNPLYAYGGVVLSNTDIWGVRAAYGATRLRPFENWDFDFSPGGRGDLIFQYDHQGQRRWQVRPSTGSAFVYGGDWTNTTSPGVQVVGIGDADNDGDADLYLQYDNAGTRYWQVRRSEFDSFGYNGSWSSTTSDAQVIGIGDANGDGNDDLFIQYDNAGRRYWQVRLSTGSSFAFNGSWTNTTTPRVQAIGVGDANGDGMEDLFLQYDSGGWRYWQVRLSTGSAFAFNGSWTSTNTPGVKAVGIGDADNDGDADLYLQYDSGGVRYWQVRRSTGTSFAFNGSWTSTSTPGVGVVGVGDANADGRDDLFLQYDYGGRRRWQVRLSTGTHFTYNGDWGSTTSDVRPLGINDVNNDGRADLLLDYYVSDVKYWQARLSTGTSFAWNGNWSSTTNTGILTIPR